MKSKFINVFMFAAGAAIGSVVTWKVLKTKYDKLVQEEIDSVKEVFAENFADRNAQDDETSEDEEQQGKDDYHQVNWSELEDLDEEDDDDEYAPTLADIKEYNDIVTNYTNEKGGVDTMKAPYVISPYDYGELDGYHTIELTYYMDEILEDDEYHIVTDADELIGPKALTTFGEYEDDSVFVRNDYLKTDFQILRDPRTYDEAHSINSSRVDD